MLSERSITLNQMCPVGQVLQELSQVHQIIMLVRILVVIIIWHFFLFMPNCKKIIIKNQKLVGQPHIISYRCKQTKSTHANKALSLTYVCHSYQDILKGMTETTIRLCHIKYGQTYERTDRWPDEQS